MFYCNFLFISAEKDKDAEPKDKDKKKAVPPAGGPGGQGRRGAPSVVSRALSSFYFDWCLGGFDR